LVLWIRDFVARVGSILVRCVFDDEHLLAGPDQAQIPAGDFLERLWILPEPADQIAQAGILAALARDRGRELIVLSTGTEHGDEPAFADERIDDDYRGDEEQHQVHDAA